MVKKFYAKLTQSANDDPNGGETVDAFQALKLVDSAEIFTKPKEKGTLFDIETGLRVRPFTGRKTKNDRGLPYFSFYPNEDSPLKGLANSVEWSDELKLFIRAFEHISKFQIEEYDEPPVYIFPSNMRKLISVSAGSSFYVLKFLVEIGETQPYSNAYLYNCRLGI
ncbi:hypothetical protein [Lacticaseibacillus sharpeae]|uniref:hypothetical protein n=1 Tax=Lacticaseibacillus sharpeae TaxID=1626 RepID=UPI0006D0C2F2|nr:hypothetical protein [Lacticaseibacillus sharpeae]